MPVSQVMTFSATPPTTGETPTTFNFNAISCWSELKLTTVPNLNTAFTQMNALEANVNAKEASTVYSADIASAAANFQGEWVSQGYALGQSVSYGGTTYMCKLTHASGFVPTNTTYWQPTGISSIISGAAEKSTLIDADIIGIGDSASSFSLKKLTWANLKTTLGVLFAPLASPALTGTVSINGANVTAYGKNYLINGGFDYWNYATTQTSSGYGSDDRWINANVGSTKTHSQVLSGDTERALFNSSKFSRTVVVSVVGAGNATNKEQSVENVAKLADKTVTISFWAKADATKNIAIELVQNFGTGGTPSATVTSIGSQLVALTSTWQKKSITVTLPSIVGKTLGTDGVHTSKTVLRLWFDAGSTFTTQAASIGQQSGTFDIAEVKLEEGSVATPWTPYNGEFGGELQACRRYYEKSTGNMVIGYAQTGYGIGQFMSYKVEKRITATISSTDPSPFGGVTSHSTLSDDKYGFIVYSNAFATTGYGIIGNGRALSWTASAEL